MVREDSGFGSMGLTTLFEMGSSFITHSCLPSLLLSSHFLTWTRSHGSISGKFGGELVKVDSEIIQSMHQISSQRVVKDILRQIYITIKIPMDLLAKEALLKEKTGTVIFPWTSNGFSHHQFFIKYFYGLSFRTGIVLISLAWRETGSRYLEIDVSAIDMLKLISRVSNFIIVSKLD